MFIKSANRTKSDYCKNAMPAVLTYEDILKIGNDKVIDDFHCVTGWTKESAEWEGIWKKKKG